MTHKQESGRTVLETIAVLTIAAVLLITSIGGIAFLIQRNNRKQSTKEVASMVTAISTSNVLRKYDKGKQIPVREVVQGPKASDAHNEVMILSEGENSYMIVTSLGNNAAISALQVQPGTCSEVLKAFNNQQASIFVDEDAEKATSATDFLTMTKTKLSEKKDGMKLEHFTTTDDLDKDLIEKCNKSGLFYVATGTEARYLTGDTLTRCPLYTAANGQLLEELEDRDGECCASFGCGNLCGCKGTCVDNKYCGCTTNDDCYNYQTCDKSPDQPVGQCVSVECTKDSECRTGEYCENFQCLSCQDHAVFNSTTRTCECKAGFTLNPTTNECVSCYPTSNPSPTNPDKGCNEDKPYCQKGSCVTCYDSISDDDTNTTNTDMGCTDEKPYCKNGSCVACQKTLNTPHLGCDEDAPLCDNGQCAVCYPDETKQIDPGCTQDMPTCKNGKCQACDTDADCPTSKPEEGDGAYYCDDGQCKKCDTDTPFRANENCWACQDTVNGITGAEKDMGCQNDYTKPFCADDNEEGNLGYGKQCGQCTLDEHCGINEVCNNNTCLCKESYKLEDGKCLQCLKQSDCTDLTTFCVTDKTDANYGSCLPCNSDGSAKRPHKDSDSCECPSGSFPFFNSTIATTYGGNGGDWTCKEGCSQHIHCPENECCSCVGSECTGKKGECKSADANGKKWYRPQTSNEACTACKPCEKYDAETNQCVANCEEGEACVPLAGGGYDPNNPILEEVCGGWACVAMKTDLIHFKGQLNGRDFYVPPSASRFRMTHAAATRFCEYHGLKLAPLAEACDKDYAYDSGHDCPNITGNQSFKHYGKTYLLKWWHVMDTGSFWLADISTNNALRVTWGCGNNHMANMCHSFYPLCTKK